jgi:hypothetical protein
MTLTPEQIEDLYLWLDEHHAQAIDAPLKADLEAGRMDDRIQRALAGHKAGNTQPCSVTRDHPSGERGFRE